MNLYKIIGVFFVLLGLSFNEWTIKFLSGYQSKFASLEKSIILLVFQLILILIGIYILRENKKAVQNLLLLFSTFFIIGLVMEMILSIPAFQNLSSQSPLWVPQKYKDIGAEYNECHRKASLTNKYKFNDENHPLEKDYGIMKRIAVLGDSFVWGAGVPDSVIWTNRLEERFNKNGFNYEIMNWGISGWSTLDQFLFLKNEGYKYEIDLLIFGFVVNDPVMDSSNVRHLIYSDGFIYNKLLKPALFLFPNTISFVVDLINNFLATYSVSYSYAGWLEDRVYSQDNLYEYSKLLKRIKTFCNNRKINFVFIMTPENHNPVIKKYFFQIEELFNDQNIPYFNLFPVVKERLSQYSIRELWATPADGHPNELVTEVYSEAVYDLLIDSNIVKVSTTVNPK